MNVTGLSQSIRSMLHGLAWVYCVGSFADYCQPVHIPVIGGLP